MINKIKNLHWFLKLLIVAVIFLGGWFGYSKFFDSKSVAVSYKTVKATKGQLVISVTSSGQVSSSSNGSISTQAGGVVAKVYVKNDQLVNMGDKIAELTLDQNSQQKYLQALSTYQNAKNTLESAKATEYTLQSQMYAAWKKYTDIATNNTFQNPDGSPNSNNRVLTDFTTTQDDWLAAEAKYKLQQNVISQAQTALSSSWYSLNQYSPVISAPISGRVTGLSLQEGQIITQSNTDSSSSTNSVSSQRIASILTEAMPTVSLSLSEIDVTKVKVGNKATVTFDALPNKTFTGKVISVDTAGTVSSGVTSYTTVIALDTKVEGLYSNMSATAKIITQVKDDVLQVPVSSVKNQDDLKYVQVLVNGKPKSVEVEVGVSNSSFTEIISGISENTEVISQTINGSNSNTSSQNSSPFSGLNRGFGGMTGGNRGR